MAGVGKTVSMDKSVALSDEREREFHPERIILFGSYADGEPIEDSDVDLLIILPVEGKRRKRQWKSALLLNY